jgi:hypothetical protein
VDDEIADVIRLLRSTDQRLMSVLGAASSVFRTVLQPDSPSTYGATGRIRER